MSFEHFERGYLLPKGCKDLIDVIRLQAGLESKTFLTPPLAHPKPQMGSSLHQASPPPELKGDLYVSDHTTAQELAVLLGQQPLQIIADAMELGVFATLNQALGFRTVSRIARKYGYVAKKTG